MTYPNWSLRSLALAIGLSSATHALAQSTADAVAPADGSDANAPAQPSPPVAADGRDPEPPRPQSTLQPVASNPPPEAAATPATAVAVRASENQADNSGPETLLGSHYKVGGFGGLGVMYTRFAKSDAVQVCGEGALLLNHVFSIGFGGCGITRTLKTTNFDRAANPDYRTSFGYGGGIIRYHFFTHRFVNLAVSTLVGAGGIASGDWNYHTNEYENDDEHPDFVFVVQPQLAGYVNITRWLRIGATAGYRFVTSTDTPGLKNSDLAAPVIGGQIDAGWF